VDPQDRRGRAVTAGLGLAWGIVAGMLVLTVLHRLRRPARLLAPLVVDRRARVRGGRFVHRVRSVRVARALARRQLHDLPMLLEVLGVAIGAGCTPLLALGQSRRWVPDSCGPPIDGVLRAGELGAAFPVALDRGFGSVPAFAPLVDALGATDRLGVAVGPELARVAVECRETQRRVAEQRARSMSIRLLFPLVFLVLPAFGLLTVVPVLFAGLHRL
jgi:hypothetical protein